jgi:hypothetical protein
MNPGGTRDAYSGLPLVSGRTWRATGGSSNTLRMVVERMRAEDQPFEISDTVGLASADHARHVLPSMLVRKDPRGLNPKYVDAVVYTQDCEEPVDSEVLRPEPFKLTMVTAFHLHVLTSAHILLSHRFCMHAAEESAYICIHAVIPVVDVIFLHPVILD